MKATAIIAELRDLQTYAYSAEAKAEQSAEKHLDENSRGDEHRDRESRAIQLGYLQATLEVVAKRLDALAEQIKPMRPRRSR